jgi:hypothetical protein
VTAPGHEDLAVTPAPGIEVVRVTKTAIDVAYDLGAELGECEPAVLRATVYTTVSGLPPSGDDFPVSGRTGTIHITPMKPPLGADYGPPDILFISSNTDSGLRSEIAGVGLPAPEGERRLSRAEVRRIEARREACRGDINDRTYCRMRTQLPTSGPVTKATPAEFTRSVRKSLGTYGGFTITRLECRNGTRCDAAFALGHGRRLEMSYSIEALKSSPTCWALTAFRVVHPVPDLGNFAAPLPSRSCIYQ